MNKKFWPVLILCGCAIIVVAILLIMNAHKPKTLPTNHVTGSTKTGVKLLEYCDYASTPCWNYNYILHDVKLMYSNQVQFQFRNLPLDKNDNAYAAAQTAEVAGLHHRFWDIHDTLYLNQHQWNDKADPSKYFAFYTRAIYGVDAAQFNTEFSSDKVADLLKADADAFYKTGVKTIGPTFFLDGKRVKPDDTVDSFTAYLNVAIKQKGFTPYPKPLPTPPGVHFQNPTDQAPTTNTKSTPTSER